MKVVFLTDEIPYPVTGTSRIREAQLIEILAENSEVEVLCFDGRKDGGPVLGIPPSVSVTAIGRERESMWRKLLHPLRPTAFEGLCEGMIDALRVRAEPGKLLWVSGIHAAAYLPVGRKLGYRVIFDDRRTEIRTTRRRMDSFADFFELPGIVTSAQGSAYKGKMCQHADRVVTACDLDASKMGRLIPGASVHVLPTSVNYEQYDSIRGKQGESLLFFGQLSSKGNLRGLLWFMDEVMPRLRATLKERAPRLVIAGWDPPRSLVRKLHYEKVELHENPRDMRPILADAAIAFFPQKTGESSAHQILETMASGRPVVSTPKAAEGLLLSPTYDILIADRADSFTRAMVQLLENAQLRETTILHALETVKSRYDRSCARAHLLKLLALLEEERKHPTERSIGQKMLELAKFSGRRR